MDPRCCDKIPFSVLILCDDSLRANTVVFNELRRLIGEQENVKHAVLNFKCGLHSVSLTRRPIALSIPNYWTTLVRLGHLFESGSYRFDFCKAMDEVIETSFRRVPVDSLPAKHQDWKDQRANVLNINRELSGKCPRVLCLVGMEVSQLK